MKKTDEHLKSKSTMTKADHELITDAVRTCSKVGEFWHAYQQLKTKEIEL